LEPFLSLCPLCWSLSSYHQEWCYSCLGYPHLRSAFLPLAWRRGARKIDKMKWVTPWNIVLIEKLLVAQLVKKVPTFCGKPEVHYRIYKNPWMVPVLSHVNLVHTLRRYFFKIHRNIILPCMLWSLKWSLPFKFCNKFCMYFLQIKEYANLFQDIW
jgi:hypothetical protein